MFVIGTAGHVDHGKSTLIKALTGIDPDRLQEEKDRGMTIDLGFAWLRLPSGREVSIVDVPGHERFIKNMLAGVGGIDVALLVVAADEGIMPQTEEHLAILDLLQVRRGIVALTKCDLVDDEWLALVEEDVRSRLGGTTLASAEAVAVSSVTGAGLRQLAQKLDDLLDRTTPRLDIGRPRLSIDRAFTVAGFGTVVTGTLLDGKLSAGQEVEIIPAARQAKTARSRVRGLQTHKKKEETATPGSRVAVNLAGLEVGDVQRGDVVTSPGWLSPSLLLDARLRLLPSLSHPFAHNTAVTVHTGAAEAEARVSLLEADEMPPAATCWVQLRLVEPLAVVRGDFFIIRSPNATLGGGQIVDAHPPRHRRMQRAVIAALETRSAGTPHELVLQVLGVQPPLEVAVLAQSAGMPVGDVLGAVEDLVAAGQVLVLAEASALSTRSVVVADAGWRELVGRVGSELAAYHQHFPLRRGMPQEELKSRLALSMRVFGASLQRLAADGAVSVDGNLVRLPAHEPRFSPRQQAVVDAMLAELGRNPYMPPSLPDMAARLGEDVLAAMLDQGTLVRVGEDLAFSAGAYDEMIAAIVARIKQNGKTNVADIRDLFGTSRRYAIGLLEHTDQRHITRRQGDDRVLWT